ncbi:RING-H2 finger protein ATL78 [Rutidosis leptorrhynchoides]|uniref:RING-H2 finger protein ATL78 n=1 Tax=Rutidosis leptorrhynchoides TaxID=125765 RepID=UPI003A9921F1
MSTAIPTSTETLVDILGHFYSRKLLTNYQSPTTTTISPPSSTHDSSEYNPGDNTFDANVVMVLSVLLCALIFSLGLNSIIRCALGCSRFISSSDSNSNNSNNNNNSVRLANTGVQKKALKTFPIVNYSPELPGLDTECVICLSEFSLGERVRLLPKCHHGFHIRCIDKWLSTHSSCPTCRHCLIETCYKIVGSSSSEVTPPPTVQETIVNIIAPLEPEGLIRVYRS